ncbi:MAG TPA: hypothetical protein VLT86_15305 [Vicinamibacterales bacterium]|nr:hypothetical protein [Vicinamibacterales bacterium]
MPAKRHDALRTPADAERFLERAGVVLRYAATQGLPIASLRSAAGSIDSKAALIRSIELTNHLLATGIGIEVNVVADRLTIVHRSLLPALHVLVRRGRRPDDLEGLSLVARSAYALIRQQREISAGDLRRHLGLKTDPRRDPAYEALAELQRALLVARGPFELPKGGIPYLSTEGYPYHLLHERHPDLVQQSRKLSVERAGDRWLTRFLDAAGPVPPRKLASLFRRFLSGDEIREALNRAGR